MNNIELVNYILDNKLNENMVIKEYCYYDDSLESVMYLFNNGYRLWDDNGEVSIMRFRNERPSLSEKIHCSYRYEVISKDKALEEIAEQEKQFKIERLENELRLLKGEDNE